MTRTIVFLVTLMVVLPFDGSSQEILSPGDRIRITQVDGAIFTGTLAAISAEEVQLSVDSSRMVGRITTPRSRIATLERHEGTTHKRNLVGVVGFVAGGAIAWVTLEDHKTRTRVCDGFLDFDCEFAADFEAAGNFVNNTTDDVLRVLKGMAIGAVVGALIGSAIRTENWVIVPSIEVTPSGQSTSASGFSFGLRVARVGLPW